MNADRWLQVERLYHMTLEHRPSERAAFLARASADEDLKHEVHALLDYQTAADTFLERPAIEIEAQAIADSRASLIGQQVGGYRILARLGSGGMGDVYRARDVRLERDVALKVLEPSIAAETAYVRRFEDEARSASGLNHPNIVTIYGVGDDDGIAYIAMELVEGKTLRTLLAHGPLPVSTALDLAVQLTDGLAAAHAAGIVHRDLKPDNAMVTPGGLLKILDFGIARRERAAEANRVRAADVMRPGATEHGAILGTVGYMSPEQAAGRLADYRSDQFSFGAMLYEMLSGRRAFEGGTRADTLDAILRNEPELVRRLNPGVNTALAQIVSRCLAKDPGARYGTTDELALSLKTVRERWIRDHAGIGVTRRRAIWLAAGGVASIAAGIKVWPAWRDTGIRSLAVLPFASAEVDQDIEYVCDGVTEDLIRRISMLPAFTVKPFSLVSNFKRTKQDPRVVGRQLGAGAVLTGTVSRRSGRLVISAELNDVASGRQLWRQRYDRAATDLVSVQGEIARAIVDDGIKAPVGANERAQVVRNSTDDAEAYDLFIQALPLHRQGGEAHYLEARDLLSKAVARDPTFASAFVSLASTYTAMTVDGFERPIDAWRQSNKFTRRALALDPSLPEAHAERASALFFLENDWLAADAEFRHALDARNGQLLPDLVDAYVLSLWALRRPDDALDWARRARHIDPVSPQFVVLEADVRRHNGDLAGARDLYVKAIADGPGDPKPYFGLADVARAEGRHDESIALRRQGHHLKGDDVNGPLHELLMTARGPDGCRQIDTLAATLELRGLEDRKRREFYTSPLDFARTYAQLGDKPRAFKALDEAFVEGSPGLVFLNVDRAWDSIRDDPAFAAAVKLVGLP